MRKRALSLHSKVKKAQNDTFVFWLSLVSRLKEQVNIYMLSNQITSVQSGLKSLKQIDVISWVFCKCLRWQCIGNIFSQCGWRWLVLLWDLPKSLKCQPVAKELDSWVKCQNRPPWNTIHVISIMRWINFCVRDRRETETQFASSDFLFLFSPYEVCFPPVRTGVSWKLCSHPCEIHLSPATVGSLKRQ